MTIGDAAGTEQAEGDALSGASAIALVAPTGAVVGGKNGVTPNGTDRADLGATTDVVLEFEFEVQRPGSYELGVALFATAQADGSGSSAQTTASSSAVDADITPVD